MVNILILEDDLIDQMALMRHFNKKIPDAKITVCNNIEIANKHLASNLFDWVISDYNLPDGTILDILCFSKRIKMICVSGELEADKIDELKTGGLHKYLLKDQHLIYLTKIQDEIENSFASINSKDIVQEDTDDLMSNLRKHFDDDEAAKIEVLEIFLNQVVESDIPLLVKSVIFKDGKKLKYFAHKIQSSFKLFKASEAIELLSQMEDLAETSPISWDRAHELKLALLVHFTNYKLKAIALLDRLKEKVQ